MKENGKEQGKEKGKTQIQNKMKNLLKKRLKVKLIIYTVLALVALSGIALILDIVTHPIKYAFEGVKMLGSAIGNAVSDFLGFDDETGEITIKDMEMKEVQEGLANQGIDPDYVGISEENEDYKEYIKIEGATTYPDTGKGEIRGIIKVKRIKADAKEIKDPETGEQTYEKEDLEFVGKTKFYQMQEEGDQSIVDKFSINGENLLYATINTVTINGEKTATIDIKEVNYKSAVMQYCVPADFLQSMYTISQSREFAKAVADLVKNSEIEMTIQDCVTTTTTYSTNTYKEHYTGSASYTYSSVPEEKKEDTTKKDNNSSSSEDKKEETEQKKDTKQEVKFTTQTVEIDETTEEKKEEPVERVAESNYPIIAITKADTWITYQTASIKRTDDTQTSTEDIEIGDEPVTENYDTSVIENPTADLDNAQARGQAQAELGGEVILTKIQNAKNYQKVEQKMHIDKTVESHTYTVTPAEIESKEEKFLSLLKTETGKKGDKFDPDGKLVKYKVDGSNEEKPKMATVDDTLRSGAELLFYTLSRDTKTQPLEDIMRYLMYKYTGHNYGITELDFSMYEFGDFEDMQIATSDDAFLEFLKAWEGARVDGNGNYVIADDGVGIPTVGFGIAIKYNIARFNTRGVYGIEDWPIDTVLVDKGVDNSIVDDIMMEEIEEKRRAVKSEVASCSPALSEEQIDALVAIRYQYGNIGNFVEIYNKVGNTDALKDEVHAGGQWAYYFKQNPSIGRAEANWKLFHEGIYTDKQGKEIVSLKGGVNSEEKAKKLAEQIENEWIHTKVHYNDSSYQLGPFAKWWSKEGGNLLQPFQCTWWANGRASKYLEESGSKYKRYPTQVGNGGEYYEINAANGWFKYGSTPKVNAVVSWGGNYYGHVAFVEGIDSSGIWISDAGAGNSYYGVHKIPLDGSYPGGGLQLNGYIYIDQPN